MKKRLVTLSLILMCCIVWFTLQTTSVAAAGYPDLIVENFHGVGEVAPGTPVNFSITVKNNGQADLTQPFTVSFSVLKDGVREKLTETPSYSGGLAAGASITLQSKAWTAIAGDYMIIAEIDEARTIQEMSNKNNTAQSGQRVAAKKLSSPYPVTQAILEEGKLTNLIFSDDFDSVSTVDVDDSGIAGYKWYVDRPYGAVTLTSQDYTVKDGIMTVHNLIPTYNYGLGTYHPEKQLGFQFNTGYLEVRLRIPRPRENDSEKGEKGVPAIWALPGTKLSNQSSHWVELDWLEYWGITNSRPGGYYTVCLHEQYTNPKTWYTNSNTSYQGLGDGKWHTMGWLWQKGLFVTFLDGKEVMRISYSEDGDPFPFHTVKEGEFYDGAFSQLDKQLIPIIIGGSKDNPLELDYVRVWDNSTDKNYAPQKDATDFILAYTENVDGTPIFTVDEENYLYILYGENDWKSLSDESRNLVNRVLQLQNQPTFPELLASAKKVQNDIYDRDLTEAAGEFIKYYATDSNGNLITKVLYSNYLIVLNGEFDWETLSDDMRDRVNLLLKKNGQPSFTEMLKSAEDVFNGNHHYVYSHTSKATLTKNGAKVYVCSKCEKQSTSNKIYRPYSFKPSTKKYTYDGKTHIPTLTIKDSSIKEIPSTYYTIKPLTDCKSAGTHELLVTFHTLYDCSTVVTFEIAPISASSCTATLSTTSYTYNGTARMPSVVVKNQNGTTLSKDKHYTVKRTTDGKNAGTHKIQITMKGNYSGTKTLTFKINPISISKCTAKLSTTAYTYNGKVKTPTVIVENAKGTTLKKGTHYTVTYPSGRKNAGTYKVTVKMKGNYSGTKTLTFKINPISISKCSIKVSNFTYTGSSKTPVVTVKNGGGTILKSGTHYTVSRLTGCKTIGTHKVQIKMKGNYSGKKTVTFKITPPKTSITRLELTTSSVKVGVKQLASTKASGYQVQHSASSKFTSATTKTLSGYKKTACTITLPKTKRTYYVRVRTYKTVGGVRYYSAWTTYSYKKTI